MTRPGSRSRSWTGRWRVLPVGTRLVLGAAGFVVLWTMLGVGVQYFRTYTLAREAGRLERHRQDLLAQNATLLAEIQRLRTDDQYLERLAREQLGMLRPGEVELVIVPAGPIHRPSEQDPARAEVVQPSGPFQSIGRLIQNTTQTLRAFLDGALGRDSRSAP